MKKKLFEGFEEMEVTYPSNLGGPFELHIVIVLDDEPLLQQWLMEPKNINKLVTPKLTGFCAFYGDHPVHLMLSAFFVGTVEGALARTEEIIDSFVLNQIRILRVKIESNLHASCVPSVISSEHEYYEAHIKVPVASMEKWKNLATVSLVHDGHLFLNNRSKNLGMHAIVTVRSYNTTLDEFDEKISALHKTIAENFIITSTRSEYSFYDTNTTLDKGWLFK